jgi:hypothetical protein
MKDFIGACLLGAVLGAMFGYGVPAKAQTYAVTNPQGFVTGYIQQNGNTVNVLTQQGNPVGQPMTLQPNQLTTPAGAAIGIPTYTVPLTPPSPPSPRVLQ